MKKILLNFLWVLILLGSQAYAQSQKVTGTVTGKDDGQPLPGVSIIIKGTSKGTQTDRDGRFSLNVPETAKSLIITYVGYSSQEVLISARPMQIALNPDQKALGEVVVVGYGGTKSVREVNGSIGHISGSDISKEPVESLDKALIGKTAGVQVSSSGGLLGDAVSVRIRGVNSISSSSLPLYVIDGIPVVSSENASVLNSGNGTRFDPLALINPNDIESIDVLKDAGASAIYGSRAANGVVLVTTKRGKKGTVVVGFNTKNSWASASRVPKLLNGDQFNLINNEKVKNYYGANAPTVAFDSDVNGDGQPDRVDWLKEIYQTGFTTDNQVSLSGGSDKATFYGSVRYADAKGIVYSNRLRTAQARMNLDVTPNKWLHSGLNLSYTRSLNNGVLSDGYLAGVTLAGYNAFPTISPYNSNATVQQGGFNLTSAGAKEGGVGYLGLGNNVLAINGTSLIQNRIYNPLASAVLQRNNLTPEEVIANGFVEIQPITGLKLTTKYGVDLQKTFEDQYSNPVIAGLGTSYAGLVQDYYSTLNQWVWQNSISYDRVIAQKHHITAVAGTEYQFNKTMRTYASANNFADPFFTNILDNTYTGVDPSSSSGALLLASGGSLVTNGLESYFARAGYSFSQKYFVEGTYRTDAYSGFGANSRWGKFPAVSAGWVVTEEDFLKNNKYISYLKVRGSYGKTGNSRGVGSYAARTLYGGGSYAALNGFSSSQIGNADLKWETSLKSDVGFNMGILDNRIAIEAAYFNTSIDGLILSAPVLYTVGVPNSSITTNVGSMRNRGFELTLNTTNIKTSNFTWTSQFNYTHVKNKVLSLIAANNNADITSQSTVASVGRQLGTYRLLRWAGVDPSNGNPMWYAADGTVKEWSQASRRYTLQDGTPTTALTAADQVYLDGKTGTPTWYGGFSNTLTYKNFDLNFDFVYQGGNYLYNSTYSGLLTNYFQNNDARILDRWTTPGQVTNIPRLTSGENTSNQASTRFLEKGDYVRLRTLSLGYRLDSKVTQKLGLSNLRVSGQVYNVFLITGYKGVDPDVNSNRNNTNIATGYDNRPVPQPRTYTLSLNASF